MAAETHIWNGSDGDNAHSTAANWHDTDAPASTDTCVYPALAADATKDIDGSDESAILLAEATIEAGCYLNFGSRETPLTLDTDYLNYAGQGNAAFEIVNSTEIRVTNGASGSTEWTYGMTLEGTGNTLLILDPGSSNSVGVAALGDQSGEFTTIIIASGNITLGESVTTTTLYMTDGEVESYCDATTVNVGGGTFRQHKNKPTTLNASSGTIYFNSTDTMTTVNLRGDAVLDMSEDNRAKTITTVNLYDDAEIYDPDNILTITNFNREGGRLSVSS